jgi:hypothetical protein
MGSLNQRKFPFGLNKYDIYFLTRKTQLKRPKLISLLEEKTDFYLVIDRICGYPLSKAQTKNLSFKFFVILLVFKYSKEVELSTPHKIFISKIVFNNYIKVVSGDVTVPDFSPKKMPNPGMAQIIFIMLGLFYDYFESLVSPNEIEDLVEANTAYIEKGFSELNIDNVPSMIENGLQVLNTIKDQNWLDQMRDKNQYEK